MPRRSLPSVLTVALLIAAWGPVPVAAQVCEPEKVGHLADAFYEGTAVFWQPVVEYREMVLTIGGPCEDIVKVFGSKDQIFFDLQEIDRVTDGQYTWELRRVATIDEGVQQELQAARETGEEDALWWSLFQQGAIPQGPYTEVPAKPIPAARAAPEASRGALALFWVSSPELGSTISPFITRKVPAAISP